jgi:hypothetical protein
MKTLGSLGDAGHFRDGDERAQMTEIHMGGDYTRSVWRAVQRCIGQIPFKGAVYAVNGV